MLFVLSLFSMFSVLCFPLFCFRKTQQTSEGKAKTNGRANQDNKTKEQEHETSFCMVGVKKLVSSRGRSVLPSPTVDSVDQRHEPIFAIETPGTPLP